MRSRCGEAADDTTPDTATGVTSSLNRPVAVVAGVLGVVLVAVTVLL